MARKVSKWLITYLQWYWGGGGKTETLGTLTRRMTSNVHSNSIKVDPYSTGTYHVWKAKLHGLLWNLLHISVVADNVTEGPRLNRTQGIRLQSSLIQNSFGRMSKEEPVSFHKPLELVGDDAGEGGTDKTVNVSGLLSETPAKSINLIDTGVDCGQVGPVLRVDLRGWFVHRGEWGEAAEGPEAVVGWDSMVATTLDVSSRQVVPKSRGTEASLTE